MTQVPIATTTAPSSMQKIKRTCRIRGRLIKLLITLTGGGGSGKTSLASALAIGARGSSIEVLHSDAYFLEHPDRVGMPTEVDFVRLNEDVDSALAVTNVVIVEGIFACLADPVVPRLRLDVFVDLPADLRLARVIRRECLENGLPLSPLLDKYCLHRSRYDRERYVEQLCNCCDLVVDGAMASAILAQQVWGVCRDRNRAKGLSTGQAADDGGGCAYNPARPFSPRKRSPEAF